jgi:mannose/fructose-specific phosphotransferase system component IIA
VRNRFRLAVVVCWPVSGINLPMLIVMVCFPSSQAKTDVICPGIYDRYDVARQRCAIQRLSHLFKLSM